MTGDVHIMAKSFIGHQLPACNNPAGRHAETVSMNLDQVTCDACRRTVRFRLETERQQADN